MLQMFLSNGCEIFEPFKHYSNARLTEVWASVIHGALPADITSQVVENDLTFETIQLMKS